MGQERVEGYAEGYWIGWNDCEAMILDFIKTIRGDKSFTNPEMDKLIEMIETSKITPLTEKLEDKK